MKEMFIHSFFHSPIHFGIHSVNTWEECMCNSTGHCGTVLLRQHQNAQLGNLSWKMVTENGQYLRHGIPTTGKMMTGGVPGWRRDTR